jgi:uncharacterized damage-inducible protein DinB
MRDPRYPIGRFEPPSVFDGGVLRSDIQQIAQHPVQLRAVVSGLSETQLETPYRPGGWTVRQVVHHLADSHVNAYVRIKLGLTEAEPPVKTYEEALWAQLPDSRAPIGISLDLLEALHRRWVLLLQQTPDQDFVRTVRHPESGVMRLDQLVAMYAWHGRHHLAHITGAGSREQ